VDGDVEVAGHAAADHTAPAGLAGFGLGLGPGPDVDGLLLGIADQVDVHHGDLPSGGLSEVLEQPIRHVEEPQLAAPRDRLAQPARVLDDPSPAVRLGPRIIGTGPGPYAIDQLDDAEDRAARGQRLGRHGRAVGPGGQRIDRARNVDAE
jgi:hypothetical protein